MNGFLAKPIDRQNLNQLLRTTFPIAETSAAPASESEGDANPSGLPDATLSRLLTRFLEEGDALSEAITAPYRDIKDVAKRCHDLSGAAAIFGAVALHELLAKADTAAKQGKRPEFEAHIAKVPPIWRDTRADLAKPGPADAAE